MIPVCLSIAGSDPSGGAGIQADLKVFHQHQVYGMSVVTLLTVQNTCDVKAVKTLDVDFVEAQLGAVLDDIQPQAAKTGALGNAALIERISYFAKSFSFPLVVDPVMISKHGAPLLDEDASVVLIKALLPRAFLVTPNLPEASRLAGITISDISSMEKAARTISLHGPQNVLVKGGHLKGESIDLLWSGGEFLRFRGERFDTKNTHGTGCVFSAAITSRLALGHNLSQAVRGAKEFVSQAIRSNPGLGKGYGPTNMHSAV